MNHFQKVDPSTDEFEESLVTAAVLSDAEILFGVKGRSCVNDFKQCTPSVKQFHTVGGFCGVLGFQKIER